MSTPEPLERGRDLLRDLRGRPISFRARRPPRGGWWLMTVVVAFALFIAASIGKGIYAEYLWFDSLGLASVYRKELWTQVWLFGAGLLLFLLLIGGNLWLARRLAPVGLEESFVPGIEPAALRRVASRALFIVSLLVALVFGAVAAGQWDTILRFAHGVNFGTTDPAFGREVSFYVFALPALRFIQGWLLAADIVTLLAVVGVYAFSFSLQDFTVRLSRPLKAHLGGLLIALLAILCFGFVLSIFDLAVEKHGIVQGATYTDLHARRPGYVVMIALSALAAAAILWSVLRPSLLPSIAAGGLWVFGLVITLGIYPAIVQRFTVEPNELSKEQPYIERNIQATRAAFGLDRVDVHEFAANSRITADVIAENRNTIDNIRLWDPRFLLDTFKQQQEIRPLYVFDDVDVDRYPLNGQYTEVTLAARELNVTNLPANARGWVNIHLQFTHGYGAVMNPGNAVDPFGLPAYTLQNIPPTGEPAITEPRIYYGQQTRDYVVVGAKTDEFDYETGAGISSQTRHSGEGGVGIGSFLRRLVYAWEFGDLNLLISSQITGQSRLLYRRTIAERISHIAPFLRLDRDPYLVIADGRLYWVQDAYTTTENYPYAAAQPDGFTYIRNSVKVVVDAYTGAVTFYLVDEGDPIARTYQRIFPRLLQPLSRMPASLRSHLRYPEDLFTVQADVLRTYHITDARVFYNKEDLWEAPRQQAAGGTASVIVPYYVIMRLPDADGEEFVLIRPFTAAGKPNAIAWLGARSDGDNYGKLAVYRFPPGTLTPGPAQVEASIDAQPEISRTISLLNVQGSRVRRGNLLMIPIGQSYVYVEPVYLQADENPKPAVISVVLYAGERAYMEPTLAQALRVALGQAPATYAVGTAALAGAGQAAAAPPATPSPRASVTAPPGTSPPSPSLTPAVSAPPGTALTPTATDIAGLIQEAYEANVRAEERLRNGDFAGYGQEQARVRAALERLHELSAQPTATTTPSP